MKHLITLFIALTLALATTPVMAEIPPYINFQGKATDADDKPLDGDNYNLTFRIYEFATEGDPADAIWAENHQNVNIDKGVFSVLLGDGKPTPTPLNITFDKSYWISVEINGQGELKPRQLITSVGYAYAAETAKEADHAATADTISELVIESRTDDPADPQTGRIWIRTDQ